MTKNFIRGALVLTICAIIGKIIGAFYRIPFAMIVGAEGVGLYQLVYPLYTLMLTLSTSGLPSSISKLLSEQWASGEYSLARKTFKFSMLIIITLSVLGSLMIVVFSYPLAKLQGNISAFGCYLAISPAVIFVGILSGLRGFFQARENMTPTAVSGLIEQVCKVGFGLLFAKLLIGKGIVMAVVGALAGVTISEVVASVYMIVCYIFAKRKFIPVLLTETPIRQSRKQILRKILSIALPIALGGLIMPVSLLIDSALVVKLLGLNMSASEATKLFGLQSGVVGSLSNLPVVASVSIATALLPKLSREMALGDKDNIRLVVKNAISMVLFVAVPAMVCYWVFASSMVEILYSRTFSASELAICAQLLRVGSFNIIALSLAQVSASILQGLGKVRVPVYSLTAGAIAKVIGLIILVRKPEIGIYGAEISDVVCFCLAGVINIIVIHHHVHYFAGLELVCVAGTSAIIGLVAYFANVTFAPILSTFWAFFVAGGITLIVYAGAILLMFFAKKKIVSKHNHLQTAK